MPDNDTAKTPVIGSPSQATDRGKHKVFLGYAAGTGKTFAMLDEAHRRKSRGQDVVVGIVDPHARKDTLERLQGLETIDPITPNGSAAELDTEAIVARRPELVLVDELQHTNSPGMPRQKRWQDVEALLDAGINVASTLDVHNLESLNDQVFDITGVRVADTVPDQMLLEATEVEMVDATPRALIHRMERGDVYPDVEVSNDAQALFKEGSLSALRELALREIAERVDIDVLEHRKGKRIERPWAARDRVMICVSPTQSSLRLLRRGWRIAQRHRGEVVAIYVESESPGPKEQKILDEDFQLAERLEIPVVKLLGEVSEQLIGYARDNNITQIVVGHSSRSRMQELMRASIVSSLIRELRTIDILVVAAEKDSD